MARTTRRRATPAPGGAGQAAAAAPRQIRENLPRPAPAPVAAGIARPVPGAVKQRRNPFGFVKKLTPRYVSDVIAELRKVTWPTFQETRYLTVVVAIVAAVVGLFLGGVDLFFGWIIEKLFF
jgi:preprotein translocase subunit SecE